jgi:hypothetical protein
MTVDRSDFRFTFKEKLIAYLFVCVVVFGFVFISGLGSGNEAPSKGDSGHSACMDAPEFNDCNGSGMNDPEKW